MKRIAIALMLAGCSSSSTPATTTDAGKPTGPVYEDAAPAQDGGHLVDAGHDAGALGVACDPGGTSCPDGLLCYAQHTAGADLFGRCTAPCHDVATVWTCDTLGGACGCPNADGGCPSGAGMVCFP